MYQHLIKDEDALQDAVDQINNDNEEHKPEESQDSEGGGDSESDDQGEDQSLTGHGKYHEDSPRGGKSILSDLDNLPSAIGEVWDATNEEGKPMNEAEMQELKGEIQRAVSLADKLEQFGSGTSNMKGGIRS